MYACATLNSSHVSKIYTNDSGTYLIVAQAGLRCFPQLDGIFPEGSGTHKKKEHATLY